MRITFVSLVLVLFSASFALAGNATLSKDGKKLKLACGEAGCFATIYADGAWGPKTELGPGGSTNYKKHKAKYVAQGWK